VAIALLIPFWVYVEKHSWNIPYPMKHILDFARVVALVITLNVHQTGIVGTFLTFFVTFFLPVAVVAELIRLIIRILSARR
jgi:hypothetical protein